MNPSLYERKTSDGGSPVIKLTIINDFENTSSLFLYTLLTPMWNIGASIQSFLDLFYTFGWSLCTSDQPITRPLPVHRTAQHRKTRTNIQTHKACTSDCAATVTGSENTS
ncbi:hypothetical protein L798_03037 [Zootermopsis nevadensis]|uniref:Uncharacterized protein n=1 Tax=Zootermopsis nevadensis TaxID=136037 RepID=A0A067RQJ2_ZOONE|nr:hypothetical protein L798_03037 [Zootermopsis nevadensis]